MLLLTDNAIAQRKARRFPVPSLRAAFHVGEHYEFFQVEALSPTTFSYIVGQVTIELARILEKALPGQILVGDFHVAMNDGGPAAVNAPEFIDRTASMLGALQGLGVANDRIAEFRCYLTGQSLPDGSYGIDRFEIRDKAAGIRRLQSHRQLEPAPDQALAIEGHGLRVHHRLQARVLHDLGHDAVAMGARLVDHPREDHHLVALELHALRERGPLARLHIISDALPVLQRAMLAPDLAGLARHALVRLDVLLRDRQYESIHISHAEPPLVCQG
jgi:hypothetical protein